MYLEHHGILGQKWGHKNGPPYPIDPADHSKSEKTAGWRASLSRKSKETEDGEKSRINYKKVIATTAAVAAVAAIAGVGIYAYKNDLIDVKRAMRAVDRLSDIPVGDIPEIKSFVPKTHEQIISHAKESTVRLKNQLKDLDRRGDGPCVNVWMQMAAEKLGLSADAKLPKIEGNAFYDILPIFKGADSESRIKTPFSKK